MTEYKEDEYLQLSGIQHFAFCRRQWAIIHIEQQWEENRLTAEGRILHEKVHNYSYIETRKGTSIIRNMPVKSSALGFTDICDVVELISDEDGININGYSGKYRINPVEYKRGKPKTNDADRLQVCAQAMCLEEMLCTDILQGDIFYAEIRRREHITLGEELRQTVENYANEMHSLYLKGYTPKVKTDKHCQSCSIKDLCLPKMLRADSVEKYIAKMTDVADEKTS